MRHSHNIGRKKQRVSILTYTATDAKKKKVSILPYPATDAPLTQYWAIEKKRASILAYAATDAPLINLSEGEREARGIGGALCRFDRCLPTRLRPQSLAT